MLIQTQHLGGVKAVLQESPPWVAGTLEGGDRPPTPTLAPSLAGRGGGSKSPSGTAATTVGRELSAFDLDAAHFTDEEFEAQGGQVAFPVVTETGWGRVGHRSLHPLRRPLSVPLPDLQGLGPQETQPTTQPDTWGTSYLFYLFYHAPLKAPAPPLSSTFYSTSPSLISCHLLQDVYLEWPGLGLYHRLLRFKFTWLSPLSRMPFPSDLRLVLIFPVEEAIHFHSKCHS